MRSGGSGRRSNTTDVVGDEAVAFYQLAPDVHVARVDGDLVFLDAAKDQYLCVARHDSDAVMAALDGAMSPAHGSDLLAALVDEHLLVPSNRLAPSPVPVVETARDDLDRAVFVAVGFGDMGRLMLAALRTLIDLRRGTPARWFAPGRSRHRKAGRGDSDTTQLILTCARRFDRMRPFLPRSSRCLIRSMLLLHLLRLHGADARWVFGARTHPFEAHCWLESDGIVLNDTLEHVRWFTPILAI